MFFRVAPKGPGREVRLVQQRPEFAAPEAVPRWIGSEHPLPRGIQAERVEAAFAEQWAVRWQG